MTPHYNVIHIIMKSLYLNGFIRFATLSGLLALIGLLPTLPIGAATKWGYTEIPSALPGVNLTLLLILDDASQKVYVQAFGPADRWFGWGYGNQSMMGTPATVFGADGQGSLVDVYMSGHSQPPASSTQMASDVSFCVNNGTINYSFNYPLAPNESQHYNFSIQQTNLPLCWAVGPSLGTAGSYSLHVADGSTSLTSSNTPQPRFTKAELGTGTATLYITNLLVSVTNEVQFTTNLDSSTWTTLTNLVMQPSCGTNILTAFIAVDVPRTNSNVGFWRIKQ